MRLAPITSVESVLSSIEGSFTDERIFVSSKGIILEERNPENKSILLAEDRRKGGEGRTC